MAWPVLVFDIESIPDIAGLRAPVVAKIRALASRDRGEAEVIGKG